MSLQVQVFSDYVCPYCFFAERPLNEALAEFDGAVEVECSATAERISVAQQGPAVLIVGTRLTQQHTRLELAAAGHGQLYLASGYGRHDLTPAECKDGRPRTTGTEIRNGEGVRLVSAGYRCKAVTLTVVADVAAVQTNRRL